MIIKEIQYFDYFDFCERAEEILYNFSIVVSLPFFDLRNYKNYVYGKMGSSKYKDLIWEYLMGDITIEELKGEEQWGKN